MAFNRQTFITRSITAIVFALIMAAGLLYNHWSFFILFSFIHFGCWIEYRKLVTSIDEGYKHLSNAVFITILLAGWCLLFYFTYNELVLGGVHLSKAALFAGGILIFVLPVLLFLKDKFSFLKNSAHTLMGLIYISLSLGVFISLRHTWDGDRSDLNITIPLLIIFTLWINDTMAYIVGSLIGKTQLSPISPKKTWEGTIGGAILAIAIMTSLAWHTGKLEIHHAAIISGIAAIAGTYGDLFESKLKRLAGVKDSGTIMPGHGGFLDRFDSLLFAAPCCWIYASLFIK